MKNTKKIPTLRFPEFSGEWEVKKIKDISSIKSGLTPLRSTKEFFENGEIWWVKTTDLNNSSIIKTEECITKLAVEKTSIKIYPVNSVLVAMYGGFNQIGRTGILKVEGATNQAISILNTKTNIVLPTYLLIWLNAKVFLWRAFAGSSRKDPNITGSDVGNFPIKYPPLKEQQKIADFFSQIDNRIEKLTKKKQLLEKYKKGVMQKIFNQEIRFKDDNDEYYSDWKIKKLADIGENIIGLTYSPNDIDGENGIIVLRSSNIKEGNIVLEDLVKVTSKINEKLFIKMNDIVICTRNGSQRLIGKNIIIKDDSITMTFGAFMSVFRSSQNNFIFYLFQTSDYYEQIQANLGARINQITNKTLNNFKFSFPCLEEQQKIANFLTEIDKKINLTEKQLNGTKQYKNSH